MAVKHKAGDHLVREVVEGTIPGTKFQGTAFWNTWERDLKSDIVFLNIGKPLPITDVIQNFQQRIGPECEVFPEFVSSDRKGYTSLVTVRLPRAIDRTFEQRMRNFFEQIAPLFGTIKVRHIEEKLICVEEHGVIVFQADEG